MDYIYCAVFSDMTAKFGRSTDVWKRLYNLDAEGRKFGRGVVSCFLSTVTDGVRCEREVLASAVECLTPVSRESFQAEGIPDIAGVFNHARLPFIYCDMGVNTFGPVLGQNSFSTKFDLVEAGVLATSKPTADARIKARIFKLIDNYSGPVTRSILKNKLLNYNDDAIGVVLSEMLEACDVVKEPYEKSQCGFRYVRPS